MATGTRPGRLRAFSALLLAASVCLPIDAPSARAAETEWLSRAALRQQASQPVAVLWEGVPLRQALQRFSAEQRCAVLLDRRVDPSRLVTLNLANVPLHEALSRIAASQQLGVCRVGPVVYFGPPEAARVLATSAALSAEQFLAFRPSAAARRTWTTEQSLAWPDLAEPRGVLEKLARDNAIGLDGLDEIPHDLWAAAELPALSLIERFSLVLVQYDLAASVSKDGQRLEFVELPAQPTVVKTYTPRGKANEIVARWQEWAPTARVEPTGRTIRVRATIEDHERFEDDLRPRPATLPATADVSAERYTLTVKNKPLGPVLEVLAQQFGLTLVLDREAIGKAGVSLDCLISCQAKDETADQIFRNVLSGTGLKYARDGKTVRIAPEDAQGPPK